MTAETVAFLVAAACVAATAPSSLSHTPRLTPAVGAAGGLVIVAFVSSGWSMTAAALAVAAAALRGAPRTLAAAAASAGRGTGRCALCACAAGAGLGIATAAHVVWFVAGAALGGLAARPRPGDGRLSVGLVATAVQLAIALQLLIAAAEASG